MTERLYIIENDNGRIVTVKALSLSDAMEAAKKVFKNKACKNLRWRGNE